MNLFVAEERGERGAKIASLRAETPGEWSKKNVWAVSSYLCRVSGEEVWCSNGSGRNSATFSYY